MAASISINGMSVSGSNIIVRNGKVIVDGKEVTLADAKEINITVNGNIDKLQVDACQKISVQGDTGNITTQTGDVDVNGDIKGSVQTQTGDINCDGSIAGSVSTMTGDIRHRK